MSTLYDRIKYEWHCDNVKLARQLENKFTSKIGEHIKLFQEGLISASELYDYMRAAAHSYYPPAFMTFPRGPVTTAFTELAVYNEGLEDVQHRTVVMEFDEDGALSLLDAYEFDLSGAPIVEEWLNTKFSHIME